MLSREEILKILELLRDNFSGAFPKHECVILKKGIDLDICKSGILGINRTKLRTFLRIYTNHPRYIKAHVVGANRYDLNGEVIGRVTEDEYKSFKEFQETRLKQKEFLKKAKAAEESKAQTDFETELKATVVIRKKRKFSSSKT